ncbi:MAG TPA: hypothetical protein VF396_07260, partial [Bradyrhizobium sp.]
DVLKRHHEIICLGNAAVDILRAKHLSPNGQPLFEMFALAAHAILPVKRRPESPYHCLII